MVPGRRETERSSSVTFGDEMSSPWQPSESNAQLGDAHASASKREGAINHDGGVDRRHSPRQVEFAPQTWKGLDGTLKITVRERRRRTPR